MPLINSQVPNVIGGVSQQPPALRVNTQAEACVNAMLSPVDGNKKRPPLQHISHLYGSAAIANDDAFVHFINRDASERYVVVIVDGDLKVFDLFTGTEKTVTFPDGKGYLDVTAGTAWKNFRCLTIGDFTFVVNKEIETAMDSATVTDRLPEALIFVSKASSNTTYKIFVDGTEEAAYTMGSNPNTDTVANDLYNDLVSNLGTTEWAISKTGSTIHLQKKAGYPDDFTLSVEDAAGGDAIKIFKGTTQRFSDLPALAEDGFKIKIQGDNTSEFTGYYVEFQAEDGGATTSLSHGTWVETRLEGTEYKFDPDTMPHQLVREASGDFTFEEVTWNEAEVGDEDTNGAPSFIGKGLEDLVLFRDRLIFMKDGHFVTSEQGNYFNLFRTTVVSTLAADRIDVDISHDKVVNVRDAVPFDSDLILFSDTTQFSVTGTPFTAENIQIVPIREYEMIGDCPAAPSGQSVFFAFTKGDYTGVRELFIDTEGDAYDAADTTQHVPSYLEGQPYKLVTSTNVDMLCTLSREDQTMVGVHNYLVSQREKVQNAWSKWEFNSTILGAGFIDTNLYVVINTSDGVYLNYMRTENGAVDPDQSHLDADKRYLTRLDRRVAEDATGLSTSYDADTDTTTVTLPYDIDSNQTYYIVERAYDTAGNIPGNAAMGAAGATADDLDFPGDWTSKKFYIGETYTWTFRPSRPLVRVPSQGGGTVALTAGRTLCRTVNVTYGRTSYFKITINHPGRDNPSVYEFNGRVLGTNLFQTDVMPIGDGTRMFAVLADATTLDLVIENDSFLPSAILSLEWELLHYSRAKQRV